MSFLKKNGGFADVIRCDEPSYLIWKWNPSGLTAGKGKREYSIRTNSVLRVKNGEVAVFVYKQKNGDNEDYILGPHDEKINSKNFPALSSIIGLWYEGDTPFQAEVFFINLAEAIQIKFAVPFFDVVDPRFPDFQVPVAVRGTITFKIEDYKRFVKYHQLINFSLEDLKTKINSAVSRYVKSAVANAPAENDIPLIAIESKIDMINEKIELYLKDRLAESFGIFVTALDINAIEVDKSNEDYLELKKITKDITTNQKEAELHNYQEQLRIQREEAQYQQRMATRQTNLNAYQTEISGEVGVSGADALGKMGENGVGNVNLGSQGGDFNPMTLMAGMAVGSAVGQNIAGVMGSAMKPETPINKVEPPSLKKVFFLEKEGKPTGPYDVSTLKNMIVSGAFKADSLVWTQGMNEWQRADAQTELAGIFPPEISSK